MSSKIEKSLIDFEKLSEDKDKNYIKLEKKINKLLELYDNTKNNETKKQILDNIVNIKERLKINSINSSITYPDYNSNDFIEKLLSKKEFSTNKIEENEGKNMSSDFFELSNNQKFIKKLISPETPYRSLYLYHSVGVGKTCASIQVTQNFKKYYNKRALILLPLKLKDNFRKGLFDISKLDIKEDNMEQCLGNYYLHNIVGRNKMDTTDIKGRAKKMINAEYEILSFGEFGNIFKKIEKNTNSETEFLNKIRRYFDDRVIIVDEVHNMRTVSEDVKGKEVSKIFHRLLEILKNNVLLLLSATPMFDNYNELRFILNSLLIQNGDKKIKDSEEFFDGEELNKDFEKKLKRISGNYISYMRGENPYTFPIRLYPSINKDENYLKIINFPKKDIKGEKILKEKQIKHLEFINTTMSDLQQKIYNSVNSDNDNANETTNDNTNDENTNDENDEVDVEKTDIQQRVQISNIVYTDDSDIKNTYGNQGLSKIFKIEKGKKGDYKVEYKDRKNQILDSNNLKNHSPKINLLLENINKSEGIVLVYSRYLASGVIPIAIALEHNGFNKLNNKNILKGGNKTKKNSKGSYVIISGNNNLSPNNTKEIIECVSKNNKDGDKVKVILITESGTEGLDLKNIREIHIFDPWYNLNRLEQVFGRGVRNFSHFDLEEVKRNVTLYQYVNLTQDNKRESIDFRTYRIAENKQQKIAKIERIIKRNAIDCNLNINGNVYKKLKPKNLLTSRGILKENFNINDKDGSRVCDYQKCDLKCDKEVEINISSSDETTYKKEIINYDIKIVRRYLINYFKQHNTATIEDLLKNEIFKNRSKETIYFALNNLIKKKKIFTGKNNRKGYLIYKSDIYIFQPSDIKDEKILIEEREKNKIVKRRSLDITKLENDININNNDNKSKTEIEKEDYNEFIKNEIKYITDSVFFNEKDFIKYEDIIYDILVDSLNRVDFLKLVHKILKNKINAEYKKNIIDSMKRDFYIQNNENIIYNYFIDKFICLKNNKVVFCSPIETTQAKKLQKKSIENFLKNIEKKNIKKYGYYEINDDAPDFKLIDLDKLDNNKKVSGTRCKITTSITTKKIEKFINRFNKKILKSKEEIIEIDKKRTGENLVTKRKKYVKTGYCLLYQIVLKKETNKKKLYFIRHNLNNYLNKM